MNEHLPECWVKYDSDPSAWCICDELRACQERVLNAARRIVAGFLDIDTATGDRRCTDPTCDLCVVAPLIYAALEDLTKGGQR